MNNIVYLLGAGASLEKVPILKDFSNKMYGALMQLSRIDERDGTILQKAQNDKEESLERYKYNLAKETKWFFSESNKHKSVDTLAKRLYLTGKLKDLNLLKNLMSLYLMWVQTPQQYDQRYDSFLATVLKKQDNKIKFPDNIKFISWNYDVQFEISLVNYTNNTVLSEIHNMWGIHPNCYHPTEIENPILVKLNGTGGLFLNKANNAVQILINDLLFDKSDENNQFDILKKFELIKMNPVYESLIQFAWEETETAKQSMKVAQDYLSKADAIVIIGYSFPIFNKEKDNELFDALKKNRKRPTIYIQDPNAEKILLKLKANFIEIKKRVEYEYGDGPIILVPETNTDQFLTPDDLLN
ncbi:MAG: hypothetical protein ABIS37_00465 [Bacteroidia bacterium]